jgi:hypothetical protein
MRNKKGQFVKGERASPSTEFKPREHWRVAHRFRDKEWLEIEYINKERSAKEIANDFGVTDGAIFFWLKKHNIRTRSMKEIRSKKHWGLLGKSNGMYGKRGEKNGNWKGGCTPDRQAFYLSTEWKIACKEVWKRDCARCLRCNSDKDLHVHHIVSFSRIEFRADPANLVLLCKKCHSFVHSKENIKGDFIEKECLGRSAQFVVRARD